MKHRSLGDRPWFIPLAIALIVATVGWWAQNTVEGALKRQLANGLETVRDAKVSALRLWLQSELSSARKLADHPTFRTEAAPLLARADPDSPADATQLDAVMDQLITDDAVLGWALLGSDGRVLAGSKQAAVGSIIPPEVAASFDQVVRGEARVIGPLAYPMPDGTRTRPALFVAAPIVSGGETLGVLGLEFDPAGRFTSLLRLADIGMSGETYAFNRSAVMVSDSRSSPALREMGVIAGDGATGSILQVALRNPGGDLSRGYRPETPVAARPLTYMAASALEGSTGHNIDGYLDYRGIPVVGAWTWLDEFDLGVATEVEVSEAYATLYLVRQGFWALVGLLVLASAGAFFYNFLFQNLTTRIRKAEKLGQYTLEEKIGEGGMGAVYRARHAMLRRPTAIKLIKDGHVKGETLQRFEREVQLTAQLTNPATVAIYDYGRTPEGVFYYAMEYLPGITLDSLVKNDGPQPERRVVHILRQISSSLAEAHRLGMIHRDIKPQNIMTLERGGMFDVIKVLDFGLVKEINGDSQVTAVNTVPGTPHFLSPEAIETPDGIDARSDIYALGAVGYYLLTGSYVFSGNTAMEVLRKHLSETPQKPSERLGRRLDPYLERLIMRCLAKDKADRPADGADLLEQLSTGFEMPIGEWTQRDAAEWWDRAAWNCLSPECFDSDSISPNLDVDVKERLASTD